MPFTPGAYMNDGLFDFLVLAGNARTKDALNFFKTCIAEDGAHIYDDGFAYFRGKKITFTNKNFDPNNVANDGAGPSKIPQMFQVDGEAFMFNDKVVLEVVPEAVDVIVNYQELMSDSKLLGTFKPRH